MDWSLLIGGLGIGSLLKGVVDNFLANRAKAGDRLYQEKRETYLGLIGAIAQYKADPTQQTYQAFLSWINRCKLFASHEVIAATEACKEKINDPTEREQAFEAIFSAMREDLRR
jgi:hypothetical protein